MTRRDITTGCRSGAGNRGATEISRHPVVTRTVSHLTGGGKERRPEGGGFLTNQRVGWLVFPSFGLAASFARSACQASYSGVPRRGGASGGSPPIQCGMSAIWAPLAQAETKRHNAHRVRNVRSTVGILKHAADVICSVLNRARFPTLPASARLSACVLTQAALPEAAKISVCLDLKNGDDRADKDPSRQHPKDHRKHRPALSRESIQQTYTRWGSPCLPWSYGKKVGSYVDKCTDVCAHQPMICALWKKSTSQRPQLLPRAEVFFSNSGLTSAPR
jgi:hypothetical protein